MANRSLNAKIIFRDANGTTETIDGLFESYLRAATDKINKRWVLSAFEGNRAILQLADESEVSVRLNPDTADVIVAMRGAAEPLQQPDGTVTGLQGETISAEWQPTPPDTPAITDLLPTQTALKKLLAQQQPSPTQFIQLNASTTAAISRSTNATYGAIDPYAMAWASVDAAVRAVIAVGANPDRVTLITQFDWQGDVGALVRCVQGCHDAAVAYRTPIILNQATASGGDNQLTISAVGLFDPAHTIIPTRQPTHALYLIGNTKAEMGGTAYALLHGETGGIVPQPLTEGLMRYRSLFRAMREGLVQACYLVHEGGLGVSLAQLTASIGLGCAVHLRPVVGTIAHDDLLLFSESIGRFLVIVAPENEQRFKFQLMAEPNAKIGTITATPQLHITGYDGDLILDMPIHELVP